jgi:hypothetical protein
MPQIVIAGTAIGGLTAPLTLQDSGLSCSIFEASNHKRGVFPS